MTHVDKISTTTKKLILILGGKIVADNGMQHTERTSFCRIKLYTLKIVVFLYFCINSYDGRTIYENSLLYKVNMSVIYFELLGAI